MEANPHLEEIRRLSLISSIVFLTHSGLSVLIVYFDLDRLALFLFRSIGEAVLYVPLIVAVAFIVRLAYLRLAANARIPFIDGWLIQLSILCLYYGLHIAL